ncbi:DUF512 domain-containing protein [Proteinivorax hydrogeniformans]|uniref:DUF512 domain-containing protein n=1 Tax=Proteinivorax hydrogeniformans TaxID=1826727 RepID=A0AAU8HWP7_9FIRM
MKHKIKDVALDSIAHQLEIEKGDYLITINDQTPEDIIDYNLLQTEEEINLHIEKSNGENYIFEIDKEFHEDLGLIFENPTLDDIKSCHNNCVFCFIDQLPLGMRKTLGVKDDDYRLSFLHGNYVTLTNLTQQEISRIIRLNLSPLYISIHVSDDAKRQEVMGTPKAKGILPLLQKLSDNGIEFHGQLVLCPGVNDGKQLEDTLESLENLLPSLLSLSAVPVGLTTHRTNCYPLRRFNKEESKAIIQTVNKYRDRYKEKCGKATVYAADEFYVNSNTAIPSGEYYEDYPQLENGIGITSLFLDNLKEVQKKLPESITPQNITIVTGKSSYQYVKELDDVLNTIDGLNSQCIKVENKFFGKSITVAGLLTGQDIYESLKDVSLGDIVFIPRACLKDDSPIFLDGQTLQQLEQKLNIDIKAVNNSSEILEILGG